MKLAPAVAHPALHVAEIAPEHLYERIRPTIVHHMLEYKRTRRMALGTEVSLQFENRETVLYHVHEVVRANGSWTRRNILAAIEEHQRLIPSGPWLTATVMVHSYDPRGGRHLCRALATRPHEVVRMVIGDEIVGAMPAGRSAAPASPVQYLRFAVGPRAARDLGEPAVRAVVELSTDRGTHLTPMPEVTRLALRDELAGVTS